MFMSSYLQERERERDGRLDKVSHRLYNLCLFLVSCVFFTVMPFFDADVLAATVNTVSSTLGSTTYVNTNTYTFNYNIGDTGNIKANVSNTAVLTNIKMLKDAALTVPATVQVKYNNKTYTLNVVEIGDGTNSVVSSIGAKNALTIKNANLTTIHKNAFKGLVCSKVVIDSTCTGLTDIADGAFDVSMRSTTPVTYTDKSKNVFHFTFKIGANNPAVLTKIVLAKEGNFTIPTTVNYTILGTNYTFNVVEIGDGTNSVISSIGAKNTLTINNENLTTIRKNAFKGLVCSKVAINSACTKLTNVEDGAFDQSLHSTTPVTYTDKSGNVFHFNYNISNVYSTGTGKGNTAVLTKIIPAKAAAFTIPATVSVNFMGVAYTLDVVEIGDGVHSIIDNIGATNDLTVGKNANLRLIRKNAFANIVCRYILIDATNAVLEEGAYGNFISSIKEYTDSAGNVFKFSYLIKDSSKIKAGSGNTAILLKITPAKKDAKFTVPATVVCNVNGKLYTLDVIEIGDGTNQVLSDIGVKGELAIGANKVLQVIRKNAFKDTVCKNVTIHSDCKALYSIEANAFKCAGSGSAEKKGVITMPSGLSIIGTSAFQGCPWLQTLTIGSPTDGVTIGSYAFQGCENLVGITWNKTATIGECAFAECTNLTTFNGTASKSDYMPNVSLGTSVNYVGLNAFRSCTKLYRVIVPDSVSNVVGLREFAFPGLKNVKLEVKKGKTNEDVHSAITPEFRYGALSTAADTVFKGSAQFENTVYSQAGYVNAIKTKASNYSTVLMADNDTWFCFTNQKKQDDIYVDIINGAYLSVNGKKVRCDVRAYIWYSSPGTAGQACSKLYGIFVGMNGYQGKTYSYGFSHNPLAGYTPQVCHAEYHFYPAKTFENDTYHHTVNLNSLPDEYKDYKLLMHAVNLKYEDAASHHDVFGVSSECVSSVYLSSGTKIAFNSVKTVKNYSFPFYTYKHIGSSNQNAKTYTGNNYDPNYAVTYAIEHTSAMGPLTSYGDMTCSGIMVADDTIDPPPMSKLTVKPNGGKWNGTSNDTVHQQSSGIIESIPDPVWEGHSFTGWMYELGAGCDWKPSSKVYTYGTGDSVLTATWSSPIPNKPKLTIKPNGGKWNGSTSDTVHQQNTGVTESIPDPVWEGHSFTGWSSSLGAGCNWKPSNKVYTYGTGDSILTARWSPVQSTPKTYDIIYHPNGGTGSIPKQTVNVDTNVTLAKNVEPNFAYAGYYNAGGWSKNSGFNNAKSYDEGGIYKNLASAGSSITLYARWLPKTYKVYYDKNVSSARIFGTPNPEEVKFKEKVDVSTGKHFATRTGWSFIGWARDRHATSVLSDPYYLNEPNDITLYAVYKKLFTVKLMHDNLFGVADKAYERTGGSFDTLFKFDDSTFLSGSTKTDKLYSVVLNKNGASTVIDKGSYKDPQGRIVGSAVAGNKITATRYFNGWYDKDDSSKGDQSDTTGKKFGGSKTYINVEILNDDAETYKVSGDKGTFDLVIRDNLLCLYPIYDKAYIRLPGCERNKDKEGNNGEAPDTFIGWFTNPQVNSDGSFNHDGGVFVGRANDIIEVNSNMSLYPWFNIAPTIVHSIIGRDLEGNIVDVSSGLHQGFYEGQTVTYNQLMALIDAYDVDNPSQVSGLEGLVTYNGLDSWTGVFKLNRAVLLDKYYPDISASERDYILNLGNYEDFVSDLDLKVVDIEYSRRDSIDGPAKDNKGNIVPAANIPGSVVTMSSGMRLDTAQKNLGDVIIHYRMTDNGAFSKQLGHVGGSEIAVDFYLHTAINFNVLPTITPKGLTMYSTDTSITSNNIENIILKKQDAKDFEDDKQFLPWWLYEISHPALDASLNIVRIRENSMKFDSAYYETHKAACDTLAGLESVKELFKYKDRGDEIFNHVRSFEVELDCVDQWGKHASGRYGEDHGLDGSYDYPDDTDPGTPEPLGQTPDERTAEIILLNNHTDTELTDGSSGGYSAVMSDAKVRYIDGNWLDSLSGQSYWGNEGQKSLQNVLNKDSDDAKTQYKGTTDNNAGGQVEIIVNDYTK